MNHNASAASGVVLDANPRAADLFGVPRERLLGTSAHALWSDAGVARAAIARGRRFESKEQRDSNSTLPVCKTRSAWCWTSAGRGWECSGP